MVEMGIPRRHARVGGWFLGLCHPRMTMVQWDWATDQTADETTGPSTP